MEETTVTDQAPEGEKPLEKPDLAQLIQGLSPEELDKLLQGYPHLDETQTVARRAQAEADRRETKRRQQQGEEEQVRQSDAIYQEDDAKVGAYVKKEREHQTVREQGYQEAMGHYDHALGQILQGVVGSDWDELSRVPNITREDLVKNVVANMEKKARMKLTTDEREALKEDILSELRQGETIPAKGGGSPVPELTQEQIDKMTPQEERDNWGRIQEHYRRK